MSEGRCKDTLEPDVANKISESQHGKDDQVKDKDYDPEYSQPVRWVRKVVQQDRSDTGAHVEGKERRSEVGASVVQSFGERPGFAVYRRRNGRAKGLRQVAGACLLLIDHGDGTCGVRRTALSVCGHL